MSDREQRIRERAHEIWQREGRQEGRHAEHWQTATAEIEAEDSQRGVGVAAAPAAKPKHPEGAPPLQETGATPTEPAMGRVAGPDELKQEGPIANSATKPGSAS